ncbi:MAG TPA: hypothetical protein VN809_08135 [Telmatospirillum sp.]|nr:hypothetical protein [Telmatospirillum sp.]
MTAKPAAGSQRAIARSPDCPFLEACAAALNDDISLRGQCVGAA